MEYIIICAVALLGSGLTLFSGFGLGTLLLPVFAIFFPVEMAIALTAIVHLLNNIFKFILLGKHTDKAVLLRFGLPSVIAAFVGAYLLTWLTKQPPLFEYNMGRNVFTVTIVKLTVSLLLIFFALFDIIPRLANLQMPRRFLPLGGLLSGFFGGLSGHQGALRSAFLVRAGLGKEAFIATGVAIACLIDITRLTVYFEEIRKSINSFDYSLIIAATAAAFIGAYAGSKLIKKITVKTIQYIVAITLIIFALLMGSGII
jgi:uncharacterized protein